jgi:GTPase SAR1 family protein
LGGVVVKVPGTTMDISLKTNTIFAVDQGVMKRIKYAGRAFMEVLEELQRFAYLRGYNAPTTILKFILKRIGLPDVEVFPSEDDLTKEDIVELSKALNVVDSLKDEFLSPTGTAIVAEELTNYVVIKPKKSGDFTLEGIAPEDVKPVDVIPEAPIEAEASTETLPAEKPSIWDDVPQSEEAVKLIYNFHWENLPTNTPTPRTKASEEKETKRAKFIWDDESEIESLEDVKPIEEPAPELLGDSHELKALVLGESQVGVKSILFECNLKEAEDLPYIYRDVVQHEDSLVGINVWTFEGSQAARIPRQEFFTGTGIAVLVYSVADRWSFDSLDFWVKELTNTFLVPPPMIIVGNKTDLRDHPVYGDDEEFDPPVTTEEGEEFCRKMAKQLGESASAHPIIFMETSSITGVGISEFLSTMIDLWLTNERPSMPSVDSHVVEH